MDRRIKPTAVILILIFFSIYASLVPAQTVEAGQRDDLQPERVLNQAETHFNNAIAALRENRRSEALAKFDKSVEVFMIFDVNFRENQKLRACFDQLLETVNRIEQPDDKQLPDIRMLSETCGWSTDDQLTSEIASLISKKAADEDSPNSQSEFPEQKSEPSPLDEPANPELTEAEQNAVNSPEAKIEYQKIAVSVNKTSLGFKFQMHPMVQQFVGYYQGRGRKTMETGLYRSGMFMRMARKIFREEGVPENVAWLGQVESAWKPTAMSWASASGLWQFIPGTGERFGLRRTAYVDERNSFEQATRASARYLKFLADRYNGNWELALAAYNSGEGNVDRAIRRAGAANFWAAYPYLPKETRNYVPNILATILIANYPDRYGFGHVRPAPQILYDSVRVPARTNLYSVARAYGTTIEYIRYLNPELRSNITPPEPYIIRVPAGITNNGKTAQKKANKEKQ
jgi:membrane-bound lytic murein transglycosylase D